MIVSEWGAHEDPADPGREAAWIEDAAAQLKQWPDVIGVLYFEADRGCARWVDSSPQTNEAFRVMGAGPHFNPPSSILPSPAPG
jgi:hypothetical protein